MTRIIAGELRGRRLAVPDSGTRPTSDRVREAIFNILLARTELDDASVVDLYAGSGALGLEALSRGAARATFVDSRRRATTVITANVRTCGVAERVSVITRSVSAHLAAGGGGDVDVAFLDPPYDLDNEAMSGDLAALSAHWMVVGGIVVVERAVRAPQTHWPDEFTVLVHKSYGDTRVEVAVLDRSGREECDDAGGGCEECRDETGER
ncbi:16S rRNA (guanine(966)-N(2))-methyltransferase RsmD [Gordonia tangerina]|uniref:16S rRNA (Guanine(966)-N(2))-methyltransferase RsmD n=1 Tax=Gordonia tangerina TaxID=2911060 RepID=A0ABS9DES3_9ACTN|nr:16S rRNA (guanine(966)-N(2))-methyltransferase RsmD [Gordonia tangerina]MCF3937714.1 16S rRNA (guanine(966)-N(2))-methyltransferase RsmD [Gordonia tangerina]